MMRRALLAAITALSIMAASSPADACRPVVSRTAEQAEQDFRQHLLRSTGIYLAELVAMTPSSDGIVPIVEFRVIERVRGQQASSLLTDGLVITCANVGNFGWSSEMRIGHQVILFARGTEDSPEITHAEPVGTPRAAWLIDVIRGSSE